MKRLLLALACAACSSPSALPDAGLAPPRDAIATLLAARPAMKSPRFRVQVLTDVATALVGTGSTTRARASLSVAASEALHLSDPGDRERALLRLAAAAHLAEDSTVESMAMSKLSGGARADALAETVRTVGEALRIEDPAARDRALVRLGKASLTEGKYEEAAHAIARIQDNSQKAPLVGALASKKLEGGQSRDVDNWLRELDALPRAEVLSAIAVWSARKGNAKGATRALKSIEPEHIRARTLATQARGALRPVIGGVNPAAGASGAESERLEAAAEKQISDIRNKALAAAAVEGVVRAWLPHYPEKALAILGRFPGQDGEPELLASIVEAQAALGRMAEAEGVAARLEQKPVAASSAQAALARGWLAQHERGKALAAVLKIRQPELAIPVLAEVAARFDSPPTEAEAAAMASVLTAVPVGL